MYHIVSKEQIKRESKGRQRREGKKREQRESKEGKKNNIQANLKPPAKTMNAKMFTCYIHLYV